MNEESLPQTTRDALAKSLDRRNWDGLAAIIAALVGLLALTVSGYTAMLQRQQVRAQVWPYLETGVAGSKLKVTLSNRGVGPAIVRSMQIYADGKPQYNWNAVFATLGLKFEHKPPYSTVNGVVIPANERIDQLVFQNIEDFNSFIAQDSRIKLRLCYCSTLNECWMHDEREEDSSPVNREVDSCPAKSKDDFIDNGAPEPAVPTKEKE